MHELVDITKALADPSRVRILHALRRGELCVCQIVELLGLATSTVSKHISVLRSAGLLASRKDGRWVYYRRPGADAPDLVRETLRWLDRAAAGSTELADDDTTLQRILETPVEDLCKTAKN